MSTDDIRRLREDASPELREALDSSREDEPTPGELEAIAAGLPGTRPAAPSAPPWRRAGRWVVPGVGLLAVVAALLALRLTAGVAPPPLSPPPAQPEPEERVPPPAAPVPPPFPAQAPPAARVPPRPSGVQVSPSAPAATEAPSELELVERALGALRHGDAARALELTDEHLRRFATGSLQQEREVIRIEALLHLGRDEEARLAFASFEAAFPESGHRVRLLGLFDGGAGR